MNRLDQFKALISYVRDNPQVIAPHGEDGKQILNRIEEACLNQDVEALEMGIDSFLTLLMGERTMRGFAHIPSDEVAERFNSIQKVTRSALEKLE